MVDSALGNDAWYVCLYRESTFWFFFIHNVLCKIVNGNVLVPTRNGASSFEMAIIELIQRFSISTPPCAGRYHYVS